MPDQTAAFAIAATRYAQLRILCLTTEFACSISKTKAVYHKKAPCQEMPGKETLFYPIPALLFSCNFTTFPN